MTGPPGAGKSTLVDQLILAERAKGKTVAVLAVDPSSTFTGGAILGDRIRMTQHHADPHVFIRSMATRGAMGGLAPTAAGLVSLFDAAGFDTVIVETVGVGQDEVDVARVAQVTLVVLVPGMGDEVQAIKAGIMEIADIFVLNKADRPGVEKLEQEISQSGGHPPPMVRTVASEGKGIAELLAAIDSMPRRDFAPRREFAIDHLGIAVRSIDESLKVYGDILGLAVSSRETVDIEKVHVAMLPVGESRIELLEAAAEDSIVAKFIARRGEGLHHVALRVPDFAATVERLRSSGARLLNEPRAGAGGHTYVFIHPASTGGVLLELIEDNTH